MATRNSPAPAAAAALPPSGAARRTDWPRIVLEACRLIERAPAGKPLPGRLGFLGVSEAELRRQFRARLGTTPRAYAEALRLRRLAPRASLERTALDATLAAGFDSAARGYAVSRAALGLPPGKLRGAAVIGCWLGLSELGWMLMGATSRGICWLAFGGCPDELHAQIRAAFPRARLAEDGPRLRAWFEQVREQILLPGGSLDLPMDVRGTAFQSRVWAALRRIPLGETRSYGELARQLGRPRSARAVAAACRANRLALLIPCHRVVAADGSLAGYRWGMDRKRELLERERGGTEAQIATSTAGSRRL